MSCFLGAHFALAAGGDSSRQGWTTEADILGGQRTDADKIREFERLGVPVDVYGVGSALVHGSGFDHPADIVRLAGRPLAKVGRAYAENPRLHDLDWGALTGERAWASSIS